MTDIECTNGHVFMPSSWGKDKKGLFAWCVICFVKKYLTNSKSND